MQEHLSILKKYWGYSSFRSLQDEIILSIANGRDTLGLMPTGGGKSITFQVPALSADGVCIVITPLIALMKDQVENLKKKGIKAVCVFSGMTKDEILVALDKCILGDYKFLYISPERLLTDIFIVKLEQMNVSFLVVDESHCISQWGYDFRPSYLQIAKIREYLPEVPVLALTATATTDVVNDIQEKLLFKEKNVFQKSFARENISYIVREEEDKSKLLLKILHSVDGSAIVYVRNRKKTKEISEFLNTHSILSDYFHAGLNNQTKDKKQQAWKSNTCRVIVATNAFGMGIDKPDVRIVVHLDLPDSLEAYFQEAGRAGRDEKRAYAVLLYAKSDATKLKKRIADSFPEKEKVKRVYEALGNYLELAVGDGIGAVYDFNFIDFCSAFHFSILPTYSSLKILQQAGYIEFIDELENSSRFMFSLHRDEFYRIKLDHPLYERVLNLLLRLYTGSFSDFVRVYEDDLASKLNISRKDVYDVLIMLGKLGVIKYIPGKKTPLIIYTQQRVDINRLHITKEVYELRKERFESRIFNVLQYAQNQEVCRSRFLLSYFDEKNDVECGVCDVCLKKKKQALKSKEFELIQQSIRSLINSSSSFTLEKLVDCLPFEQEKSLKTIRFMIDNGFLFYDENQCLIKKTSN